MKGFIALLSSGLFFTLSYAITPDWSKESMLPSEGHRANIYQLSEGEWQETVLAGKRHALLYPVTTTELLIPFRPLRNFLELETNDPIKKLLAMVARDFISVRSYDEFEKWLGLNAYPETEGDGVFQIPYPNGVKPKYSMGTTFMERNKAIGVTYSCAACHTGELFGRKVLGLTNRFPRANDFFVNAKKLGKYVPAGSFIWATGATKEEGKLYKDSIAVTKWIGTKEPQALGLDTSLASVGLSLAHRGLDDMATRAPELANHPRKNPLSEIPADSKPMVWWNLKYKTRWLSDGSVISGNPIFTNFLWNEIGRGADLNKLEQWMKENQKTIEELTAAVFATKSPRYTDFFRPEKINQALAMRGEIHFKRSCQGCHGEYVKGWSIGASDSLKTVQVNYPKKTKVKNVGTDPYRAQGMKYFADDLNRLRISKMMGTVVEPQAGYVPPPLDGIWARYPYFHNNSIPNLCQLLTKGTERVKTYYSGAAIDPEKDYDHECAGYPLGEKTPVSWKIEKHLYKTELKGLSNLGHDEGIFIKDGNEIYSQSEKRELIEFLKTL